MDLKSLLIYFFLFWQIPQMVICCSLDNIQNIRENAKSVTGKNSQYTNNHLGIQLFHWANQPTCAKGCMLFVPFMIKISPNLKEP